MAVNQALTDSYTALSGRLLTAAGQLARNTFLGLGSWRDEDVQRYLTTVESALTGAKREAAKLSLAYYREVARSNGKAFIAPKVSDAVVSTEAIRNGVEFATVYQRPFVEMRTLLSQGKSLDVALEAGALRAEMLARTDVQLARRNASLQARKGDKGVVGYLRVLSGNENCALCYVASTQRYRKGDLQPIHPGCDCGETQIYGTQDVGQVIDQQLLDGTHEAIEQRFGFSDPGARAIDYRKQILVQEHGELGPVLTLKDQHFTGPSDL
jgi:hypothetical protein